MITMKPETIERRRIERIAEHKEQRTNLVIQLSNSVIKNGIDSIYYEMLIESVKENPDPVNYNLLELKEINLNIRLGFPSELFAAINNV